jgi:DNA polymerase III epsilon subunit-like protein
MISQDVRQFFKRTTHGAAVDTEILAELYLKLIKMHKSLTDSTTTSASTNISIYCSVLVVVVVGGGGGGEIDILVEALVVVESVRDLCIFMSFK